MIDYVIGEDCVLPSEGKVYKGAEVNAHVRLRSMTTNEEMRRLSPSDNPYKVMSSIIDDCLVEKPGISSYDMCIGDYQMLLYKLRVVTYGADYNVQCKCPYCLSQSEETVNIDELPIKPYEEEVEKYLEFDLPKTKHHIRLQMQTPRMIDSISAESRNFRKKAKNFEGDPAFLFTLKQ